MRFIRFQKQGGCILASHKVSIDLIQRRLYRDKMIVAFVTALIGSLVSLAIGTQWLQCSISDVFYLLLNSNIAALIALIITLRADQFPSPFKEWAAGTPRAWALLVTLYTGILLSLSPILREQEPLFYLFFPLVLSSGFAILAFGPIRDRMVRNSQRRQMLNNYEAVEPR